jgi:ADP-ribosylglycohydrolase
MSIPTPSQRVGCLIGLALGDALGFVVEAEPAAVAAAYVREELRSGRAGARGHPSFPFGQYSDDTQLTRELLLSIREAGRFEPAVFARRLAAFFAAGRDVGAGPGSRGAGLRLAAGTPWNAAGAPAPYAGNGSAMRAAPLGVLYPDAGQLAEVALVQSRVTHHDSRCAAGALAMAGATAQAARRGPIDPRTWIAELRTLVDPVDPSLGWAIGHVPDWVGLDPDDASRELHAAGLDPGAPGDRHGISAHVVPSVTWALYAFLGSPDSYWDTICTAIVAGGDTDSMAAMAGALAGSRLGIESLPSALVSRLNDRGEWGSDALASLVAGREAL